MGNENYRKYATYSTEELEEHLKHFPSHVDNPIVIFELQRRQNERFAGENKSRHEDAQRIGSKTLFWARWAVVAAVLVPITVALIQETPLSKLLRAIPSKSRQQPSPKTQHSPRPLGTATPASVSPTVSVSPSAEVSPPE
jgi:hypothetical protein